MAPNTGRTHQQIKRLRSAAWRRDEAACLGRQQARAAQAFCDHMLTERSWEFLAEAHVLQKLCQYAVIPASVHTQTGMAAWCTQ